ncbi:hypothetical protein C3432_01995 [Citrobacter amalonaticus]|uniref:Uncharacterized protein n=1 Tax=Citrobacter amalonaticus TaxID=35703 RepID=A0A2S4S2L2_CITAM|nr:hypothetical protein [Citrobacter amalonaticus]POT59518.1 hypothetical protein C3432_01995 [Citrobacter amalonaticus]POT77648.1 hypothetical protein C3436_09665 [Citrobacter amalonaticus]POU68100.1 hypothetical protein C3430_03200 [Citrobacter amalonaticus]POV07704.1 hypothetical protein C3424_03210 [Citrobacter amalonaticus]
MLKKITVRNIPGVSAGKIIKNRDIISYQTFNQIYDHAQRHARTTIRDAEAVANDLHSRAWTEGYVSGMTFAIQDLAKFVHDHENNKNHLITSALETVTVKLKEFFDHEESICQLLNVLVERLTKELQDPGRVIVTVPEKLHPHSHKVKHIFDNAGLAAEIKKSPHATIVVEYGKEIWTYDLNQVADNLARTAIKKALDSSQLNEECVVSSLDALQNIRDTLDSYLSSSR